MSPRRYALETYRSGRRIDRDNIPLLVVLDLDDRDPYTLAQSRDLLNRYLVRAARADGAGQDRWHEFEFAVLHADEDGRPTGRELFRWALPDPPSDEEVSRWAR
jgi:hypothetical protein